MAGLLPSWFLPEDLEGAAGIALVKAASRYDDRVGTSFRQFARPSVLGACFDASRRREYRERGHSAIIGDQSDPQPSPEASAIAAQRAERARDCVAELPARHRLAIERIYFDGLTLEEAAPEFGVGASRLCQLHREALAMLGGCLGRSA